MTEPRLQNISKYLGVDSKFVVIGAFMSLGLGFLMSSSSESIGMPADKFYMGVEIETSTRQLPQVAWCDITNLGSSQGFPFTAQSTNVREGCVETSVFYPLGYLLNTSLAFAFIYMLLIPINRFLIKAK